MRTKLSSFRTPAIALVALALALPAQAAITDFTLTRAIPPDASVVMHTRHHAGTAFVDKQSERIWEAIKKAEFERDIRRFFKSISEEGGVESEAFNEMWQKVQDQCALVDWEHLAQREYAFALRVEMPLVEFVSLMVPPADKIESSYEGLSGILKTIKEMDPERAELVFTTEGSGSSAVSKLSFVQAPMNLTLTVAREKEVLLVGFGSKLPEQSLGLLRGGSGPTLAASERFTGAFKSLPPPADAMVFVDTTLLIRQSRGLIDWYLDMASKTQTEPLDPKWKALPGKIIEAFDMFDYVASVSTTDGMKTTSEALMPLKPEAKSRLLYPVLFEGGSISDPLKNVPQDAVAVSVGQGPDFLKAFNAIVKFVETEVPEGAEGIAEMRKGLAEMKEQTTIDLEKDVLGVIGTEMISFSMKPKNAFTPGDWAVALKARDGAAANATLNKIFELIKPMAEPNNVVISDANIEGAEGFRSIGHPMLIMMPGLTKPTIGVWNGYIVVGSTPKVIASMVATGSGKADSFAKSERYQKESLQVPPNAVGYEFADLTGFGAAMEAQFGQVMQAQMLMGSMPPEVAKNPVLKLMFSVMGKLGPVFREVNFLLSSSTVTTMDGNTLHTKTLVNYQEPKASAKPAEEPADEPKEGSESTSGSGS